ALGLRGAGRATALLAALGLGSAGLRHRLHAGLRDRHAVKEDRCKQTRLLRVGHYFLRSMKSQPVIPTDPSASTANATRSAFVSCAPKIVCAVENIAVCAAAPINAP